MTRDYLTVSTLCIVHFSGTLYDGFRKQRDRLDDWIASWTSHFGKHPIGWIQQPGLGPEVLEEREQHFDRVRDTPLHGLGRDWRQIEDLRSTQ